jgi:hypothetical protein
MPRTGISDGGWESDDPTVVEDRADTGPHDLTGLARVSAARDRDDIVRTAYTEGQEDAIRALYAVMRTKRFPPMTRDEMDTVVLAVRARLTRL